MFKFYCTGCPKSSFLLLIKTLFLHEISRRYIFLSQVHVFRISITGMPFLFFFVTFCRRCGMKWDTACRPADDPLWAFLSPGAQEPGSWKKYILGIHREKIIFPAPFHSKAFVLLYKFETSWALLGRLSKAFFFRLSQGPLILNILNSFSGLFWTNYERASLWSLQFCT